VPPHTEEGRPLHGWRPSHACAAAHARGALDTAPPDTAPHTREGRSTIFAAVAGGNLAAGGTSTCEDVESGMTPSEEAQDR
jgi:hypothetical protein